jgi:hypothetical protein
MVRFAKPLPALQKHHHKDQIMALDEERRAYIGRMAGSYWIDHVYYDPEGHEIQREKGDRDQFKKLLQRWEAAKDEFFSTCTNPEEVHEFAEHVNWDDGLSRLKQIIQHPYCDLGTAYLIYWRGEPTYYLWEADADEIGKSDQEMFNFLKDIESRVAQGSYLTASIRFDPDVQGVTRQRNTSTKKPCPIPDFMWDHVGE